MNIDELAKYFTLVNAEYREIELRIKLRGRTIELVTEKARIVGKLEMLSILSKEL